jgi:hypothetical protein
MANDETIPIVVELNEAPPIQHTCYTKIEMAFSALSQYARNLSGGGEISWGKSPKKPNFV